MEKLLQQIRDNLRLSNWTCFPGNSITYHYSTEFGDLVYLTEYKREGKTLFSIEKEFNEWGNVIEEKYVTTSDGTDNL